MKHTLSIFLLALLLLPPSAARDLADKNPERFSCNRDVPIVISRKYATAEGFAPAERDAPPS